MSNNHQWSLVAFTWGQFHKKCSNIYSWYDFENCQFKITTASHRTQWVSVKSLWPRDAIWWHRSGSTLAQVMACCLTAPRNYLNQCWLIISKVQWHSSQFNFTRDTSAISHWNSLENYLSKILLKSPKAQWVNTGCYHAKKLFIAGIALFFITIIHSRWNRERGRKDKSILCMSPTSKTHQILIV